MKTSNKHSILFEKNSMFTKCKFCKIYKVTPDSPSGLVPHSHDYVQIWYVEHGSCVHWIKYEKHIMSTGDIFIIPPKVEHWIENIDDTKILCCEFSFADCFCSEENHSFEHMHDVAMDVSFVWQYCKDSDSDKTCLHLTLRSEVKMQVSSLMTNMFEEYENGSVFFEDLLRIKIMELLLLLAREYAVTTPKNAVLDVYSKYKPVMAKAIAYVDEHYNQQLKLEDVCRICLISKTKFCYLFKLFTQQTLVEYIMNLRIQKAIHLLKNPMNSITTIGYEVGFNDSTSFSRTFKKVMGDSPRNYRANHIPK